MTTELLRFRKEFYFFSAFFFKFLLDISLLFFVNLLLVENMNSRGFRISV